MTLTERYAALTSKQKMALNAGATLCVLAALGVIMFGTKQSREDEAGRTAEIASVAMTNDLLEDTLTERVEQRVENLEVENEALIERVDALLDIVNQERADDRNARARFEQDAQSKLAALEKAASNRRGAGSNSDTNRSAGADEESIDLAPRNELAELGAYRVADSYPEPPKVAAGSAPIGLAPVSYEIPEPVILGAISSMPPSGFEAPEKKSGADGETIYLPPGFMNARLLTGVDALVSQNAQGSPEPIMARVQAPAQLPNHVKANLQGCFVIGSATGSLAKERVEVRAVSLSCIDFEERAVIDEPIKGFFVDEDGKKGLSGRVVTRGGALVARSFVAGVLSGFGSAVEQTAGTRAISPLGEVRTFDVGEVAAAGAGGGVSQAAEDLSDLYLELARQAGPVVEVGAAKDVVLVIQEGVDLTIRRSVNVAQ